MIYELQCEGRTFYCNSSDVVSALIEKGWSVSVTRKDGRACGGTPQRVPTTSCAYMPARSGETPPGPRESNARQVERS
jgi:hypothetical protein